MRGAPNATLLRECVLSGIDSLGRKCGYITELSYTRCSNEAVWTFIVVLRILVRVYVVMRSLRIHTDARACLLHATIARVCRIARAALFQGQL